MAKSGWPQLDCTKPRYLKCRTCKSSAYPSLTLSSPSWSALFFASSTSLSAGDPACDGSLLDIFDRRPLAAEDINTYADAIFPQLLHASCLQSLPSCMRKVSRDLVPSAIVHAKMTGSSYCTRRAHLTNTQRQAVVEEFKCTQNNGEDVRNVSQDYHILSMLSQSKLSRLLKIQCRAEIGHS